MSPKHEPQVELAVSANGYTWLHTHSWQERLRLGLLLVFDYGFVRRGPYVAAAGDKIIYPDFIHRDLRVHSGWDNWVGYDFLAASAETDTFPRLLYARHCNSGT